MANLTIAVEDEVLRRARIRAAEQETSVNAVLREALERYADAGAGHRATEELLAFARETSGRSDGRTWTREDLYAERVDRYGRGSADAE